MRMEPIAVLDRRMVKRNNATVGWCSGGTHHQKKQHGKMLSTLRQFFQVSNLEDKIVLRGRPCHSGQVKMEAQIGSQKLGRRHER